MFIPKKLEFKISEAKKTEGVYCCAYACRSKPCAKKRGLCHKHYAIHRHIQDPVYDRYVNFRGNAKQRPWKGGIGIPFTITLPEFREWCEQNGYIIKRGYRGKNTTIDRVINTEGYHIWNIQLLKNIANIRKYHDIDKHITELPTDHEDYVPF
jgi:hypothetical protein